MGIANCKQVCHHDQGSIGIQSLSIKQFTQDQIDEFVNNLSVFFQQDSKDAENDTDKVGIAALTVAQPLRQLFNEYSIDLDTNVKLWKFNKNIGDISQMETDLGKAYIWNTTSTPKDHIKDKKGLLQSKIQVLFAENGNDDHIIAYFRGKMSQGYVNDKNTLFLNRNHQIYEGSLINSNPNGYGKFQNRKIGYTYEGSWFEAYPHSPFQQAKESIILDSSNNKVEVYTGQFKLGAREGNGQVDSPATRNHPQFKYKGEFKQGSFHGTGKLTASEQGKISSYCGEFNMGKKNGNGTWENEDQKYTGQWKNNMKNGAGEFTYLITNIKYVGNFKDDDYSGSGTLYKDKDVLVKGMWAKGKCILKI